MIGGTVIEVYETRDAVYVNCADSCSNDRCAILVVKNEDSLKIEVGDSIWWQGEWAMWTPADNEKNVCSCEDTRHCGIDYDIRIPRIGKSGI